MRLKYNMGLLKIYSNDVNYHMLAQIPKFSTTKMQRTHDN